MSQLPTIEQIYDRFLVTTGVNTDSRSIQPDQLFIALKGENFNGNEFADQALFDGALYAIIDEEKYATSDQHILVKDSLETLQELATFHRKMIDIPVIGITGTNGKTTTKELISEVLNVEYNCFATKGNLNNHIGVPLSILSITPETEIAIIEMGANHIGEIANLCKIAQPNLGLITNIGVAHIEGFGSKENVIIAKGELYEYIRTTQNQTVFINSDDVLLMDMAKDLNEIQYGITSNNITGEICSDNHFLKLKIEDPEQAFTITTQLVGDYNFYNVLAATAVGRYFDVPLLDVVEAIEQYQPNNNRSQYLETDEYSYIVDAYNANPSSMKVALENIEKNEQKVFVVLGDMLELGKQSEKEHLEIATWLNENSIDALLVGKHFKQSAHQLNIPWVKNAVEAKEWINEHVPKGTTLLLKGSRGIGLEKIL